MYKNYTELKLEKSEKCCYYYVMIVVILLSNIKVLVCLVIIFIDMDSWKMDNTKRAELCTKRNSFPSICGSSNFVL